MSEQPLRRQSRLRLRPGPHIVLALWLGAVAGLTVLWVLMLAYALMDPSRDDADAVLPTFAIFYVFLLVFGSVVGLIVEGIFVAPLLWGFQRYRWPWLNGWTGALIGFALAFALALPFAVLAPGPTDQTVWGTVTMAAGHRTPAGWRWALIGCAAVGVVGLVAAGVFRLIAVTAADSEEVAP